MLLNATRHRMFVPALCIVLGWAVLLPRVTAVSTDDVMLKHVHNYLRLEKSKSSTFRMVLAGYYKSRGKQAELRNLSREWYNDVPASKLSARAIELADEGRFEESVPLFREALRLQPDYSFGYSYLGISYLRLNQPDSALLYTRIAAGLNRYSGRIFYNLASVYFQRGEYKQAADAWKRSAALDKSSTLALEGLVELYRRAGQEKDYLEWLQQLTEHPKAPVPYLRRYAEISLAKGEMEAAAEILRRALQMGLDSIYVRRLSHAYPHLKDYFPFAGK